MAEALTVVTGDLEEISLPQEVETAANTKTKLITAAAIGAVGFAGALAENRGWVSGWPPPFHSLKHPWLGYYSAWAVARTTRPKTPITLGAGLAADLTAETAQDLALSPDHSVHWTHFEALQHPGHGDTNLDNLGDGLACLAGTALFLAQTGNPAGWLRRRTPNLVQSSGDEMAA